MASAMCSLAYATTYNVTINNPTNGGALGVQVGNDWIGQCPVTISPSHDGSSKGNVYCINYTGTVYIGNTYTATIATATDTPQWEAVSYILTWNASTTNTQAAIDQVAIWILLNNYNTVSNPLGLPSSILGPAQTLASQVNGFNVVHPGDQLKWIAPFIGVEGSANTTSAAPGQTVTFQVQLTDSSGNPLTIQNVRIDFTAFGSTTTAFTDSNGVATAAVTVPQSTPAGSKISVQATTKSLWAQQYLDLVDQYGQRCTQNFIGTGTALCLTTSTNLSITGFITVTPEISTLVLIPVALGAVALYVKRKQTVKA